MSFANTKYIYVPLSKMITFVMTNIQNVTSLDFSAISMFPNPDCVMQALLQLG